MSTSTTRVTACCPWQSSRRASLSKFCLSCIRSLCSLKPPSSVDLTPLLALRCAGHHRRGAPHLAAGAAGGERGVQVPAAEVHPSSQRARSRCRTRSPPVPPSSRESGCPCSAASLTACPDCPAVMRRMPPCLWISRATAGRTTSSAGERPLPATLAAARRLSTSVPRGCAPLARRYKGVHDRLAALSLPAPGGGLDFMVDGLVPTGSGLSSSAALVCAASLAVMACAGQRWPQVRRVGPRTARPAPRRTPTAKTSQPAAAREAAKPRCGPTQADVAEMACVAERYIGTQSGGMDQVAWTDGPHGLCASRPRAAAG